MIRRELRLLICGLLLAAFVPSVAANWHQNYGGPTQYSTHFTLVPDFDQRRVTLLFNGGMYCVPTSSLNWMAYIARHGYPLVQPGEQTVDFWHSPEAYAQVTDSIVELAGYMNTSALNGTSTPNAVSGIQTWLAQTFNHLFFVVNGVMLGSQTPRFDNFAYWLNMGVPVLGIVGWYEDDGLTLVRDGGHMFSVVGVSRSGEHRFITIHDPADDNDLFAQSEVTQRQFAIEPRVRIVKGVPRIVDKVVGWGSAYLDGYVTIRPLMGLTTSSNRLELVFAQPLGFDFLQDPTPEPAPSPLGALISDVAVSPVIPGAFLTTQEVPGVTMSKLWAFDPLTRNYVELVSLDDGKAVEFDRFGRLYVLDSRTIRCYAIDPDVGAIELASALPGLPIDVLAVDDVNERVLVLGDGSVLPFDLGSLSAQPPVPIPAGVQLGGVAYLAASPLDGAIFLTSDLSPGVYRLDGHGGFQLIGEQELLRPRELSIGDGDCVHVVDAGGSGLVRVFCPDPQSGQWVDNPAAPFAGLALGRALKIAHTRTNYDPAIHDGPEYHNVLPLDLYTAAPDDPRDPQLPALAVITGVAPNPFNPSTTVQLELPRTGTVTLAVHDMRGRLVRSLWQGTLMAGRHQLTWDGADESGTPAASGVYVLRLTTADGAQQSVKITLSK